MSTLIVIPTYNEAENILRLLDQVLSEAPTADVLVVDDSSPDGTPELVRTHPEFFARVHLLSRSAKDGLGNAYRAGFAWALDHGFDVVVQMDADLSHPPARIPALLAGLQDADVVIGSRYVPGGGVTGWTWYRSMISRAGNAFVRSVLDLHTRDATAGFRAWQSSALRTIDCLDSESNGYCFQVETTWCAERYGLRVAEVPIDFTDRTAGASKMSPLIAAEAVMRALRWRRDARRHPETARQHPFEVVRHG